MRERVFSFSLIWNKFVCRSILNRIRFVNNGTVRGNFHIHITWNLLSFVLCLFTCENYYTDINLFGKCSHSLFQLFGFDGDKSRLLSRWLSCKCFNWIQKWYFGRFFLMFKKHTNIWHNVCLRRITPGAFHLQIETERRTVGQERVFYFTKLFWLCV